MIHLKTLARVRFLFKGIYVEIPLKSHHVPRSQSGTKLAPVSEAEVRAAFTARLGMPLTGQMLHGTLPFYPSLTVIEGEPTYIHKQMQQNLQEQTVPPPAAVVSSRQHPASAAAVYHTATPITDTQVAHARLHKAGHRPLGSMFPLCLRRSSYNGNGLREKKKKKKKKKESGESLLARLCSFYRLPCRFSQGPFPQNMKDSMRLYDDKKSYR